MNILKKVLIFTSITLFTANPIAVFAQTPPPPEPAPDPYYTAPADLWKPEMLKWYVDNNIIFYDGQHFCGDDAGGGSDLDGHKLPATTGGTAREAPIDNNGKFLEDDLSEHVTFTKTIQNAGDMQEAFKDYYITMRWRYAKWNWNGTSVKGPEDVDFYSKGPRVLVSNPQTKKAIIAVVAEAGPAPWAGVDDNVNNNPKDGWVNPQDMTPAGYKGRVSGLAPKAFSELGAVNSTPSNWESVKLNYAWAKDQKAKPGPVDFAKLSELTHKAGSTGGGGGGGTTVTSLPSSVPEPYNKIISQAAAKFGADPFLVATIFLVENRLSNVTSGTIKWREPPPPYGNGSPWPTSFANAQGPFQFLPGTWAGHAQDGNGDGRKDIQDLVDAAHGSAHFIVSIGGKNGIPLGDPANPRRVKPSVADTLVSYNAGPAGGVRGETIEYVKLGIEIYNNLKKGGGGGSAECPEEGGGGAKPCKPRAEMVEAIIANGIKQTYGSLSDVIADMKQPFAGAHRGVHDQLVCTIYWIVTDTKVKPLLSSVWNRGHAIDQYDHPKGLAADLGYRSDYFSTPDSDKVADYIVQNAAALKVSQLIFMRPGKQCVNGGKVGPCYGLYQASIGHRDHMHLGVRK